MQKNYYGAKYLIKYVRVPELLVHSDESNEIVLRTMTGLDKCIHSYGWYQES